MYQFLIIAYLFTIHVLNGRLFEDTNGEITCVANNGSSVVDYILASTDIFDSILHFKVGSEDFSDHFLLHCTLSLSDINLQDFESFEVNTNEKNWTRFKWKENYKTEFIQLFSRLFTRFKDKISTGNESVLSHLLEFIDIVQKAGKCMKVRYNQTKDNKKQPPWWDNECEMAKSNKYILLRKFRCTNTGMDLHSYKAAKARFKNICRSRRLKFEKEKRAELMNVSRNPREYWRFIKQSCSKNLNIGDKVSSETFVNYFKNLLNMEVTTENENLLKILYRKKTTMI